MLLIYSNDKTKYLMKKLLITSIIIYFLGLFAKIFHFPASLLVILGTGLFIIYSLIFVVKGIKEKTALSFALLSSSVFLIYILARIFYWTTFPILGISLYLILGFGFGILSFINVKSYRLPNLWGVITMTLLFLCSVFLLNISSDRIYYFFNMRDLENNSSGHLEYDMEHWDRYSWFLYLKGNYNEASKANEIAIKAAMELNAQTEGGFTFYLEKLNERKSKIKSQSWKEYN